MVKFGTAALGLLLLSVGALGGGRLVLPPKLGIPLAVDGAKSDKLSSLYTPASY
jgi:hypothetical protein